MRRLLFMVLEEQIIKIVRYFAVSAGADFGNGLLKLSCDPFLKELRSLTHFVQTKSRSPQRILLAVSSSRFLRTAPGRLLRFPDDF